MSNSSHTKYSSKVYGFPNEFVSHISVLESRRTYFHMGLIWFCVLGLSFLGRASFASANFWLIYPFLGLLMAGRQGALLQIVHEASHRLISNSLPVNEFVGNWFAGLPVGLTVDGYRTGHMKHHAGTNTTEDLDTDLEKYSVVDVSDPALYKLFLMDLMGWTALRSFLGHNYKSLKEKQEKSQTSDDSPRSRAIFKNKIVRLGIAQFFVIGIIFQFDLKFYILLWVIPLISFNMVLLRVRGITEHGAPNQLNLIIESPDQGNRYTRSVVPGSSSLTSQLVHFIEKLLIGSLGANFHHEHHLLPKVPFYNLKYINSHVDQSIRTGQQHVFVKSYFHTLFFKKQDDAPR